MSYKDILGWESWSSERIARFDVQIAQRGFDDTDWWTLYLTIAQFTLPRLKAFKVGQVSYPASLTVEEWEAIVDKMIYSFEFVCDEKRWMLETPTESIVIQEGFELFGKWFTHLWS